MEAMKNGEDISDLMESYSLQFGPSWAPNDVQERAAYFISMMRNHSSGTYVDQNGRRANIRHPDDFRKRQTISPWN